MADDKDKRDLFTKMVGLGVGGGTAYWQFRKTRKTGVSDFRAVLDPRANILHRIQSINVDNAFNKAVKKFSIEHINNKLDEFNRLIKGNRLPTLKDLNERLKLSDANPIDLKKTGYPTQLFRKEWEAAIKATFPNPIEAKIMHSLTDPLGAIKKSLTVNPSVLMQRAFYTFQKNVSKALGMGFVDHVPLVPVSASIHSVPTMAKLEVAGLGSLGSAKLASTIESIQTALDTKLNIAHRGMKGQGEFIFSIPGRNEPVFTIAESFAAEHGGAPGLVRTGAGLHNIYAPGIFGIINDNHDIAEELTYSELKAKKILETIQANNLTTDNPNLHNMISATETEIDKLADYMEPNISHTGYSLETFFKSNQMTVLDATGKPITGQARRDVASRMYSKTGGAFTPAGSESRFSILPETEVYGPFAPEHDYARKPWQFIRQYSPTPSALEANKASSLAGEVFSFLDSPMAVKAFGTGGARAKTLYLSDEQINQLRDSFGITIGDGELLLHESMKRKLAVSRYKRINLNEINSDVASQILAGGYSLDNLSEQVNLHIPVKGILGRNAEGALISTRYPTTIVGLSPTLTKKLDKSTHTSLDLITKEEINMTDTEKVFGSLKGIARFVSGDKDARLRKGLEHLGINLDDLGGVQALARVSDIKDTARYKQALVSHWALQPHSAGAPGTSEIVNSLKNLSETEAENYMSSLASQFGGRIFDKKMGGIAVSSLYFGGEAELTGAGNMGTLEPRIFTLLSGSNPAGQGEAISNELLERMVMWAPEKVTMHNELMKTMESLNGTLSPSGLVLKAGEAGNSTRVSELLQKGGFLETGVAQLPHIYIPGWETVPELHPRMVSTGAVVETSQPSKIYKQIIKDVAAANSADKPMTAEQFVSNFERSGTGYLTQLFQETAIAGKGAGSIARGKLAGSRALRVVSETDPQNQAAFEDFVRGTGLSEAAQDRIVGVPRNMASEMFDEMKQLYGADAIADMEKRFFSGELVAGMAMRHPTIGAYSMQPVLMKSIGTDLPNIIITERMKTFTAGNFQKDIQTGILPGMAADKDADTALAILLSPDMESKMRSALVGEQGALENSLNSYRDHSIRMQLLKPKAAAERVTMANYAEMRAAEATKLAITQEEVGKLSTSLTKSRVAIMSSNLPEERKLTGLSLLEWLEQQPISGKHVGLSQALSGVFEQQMEALRQGAQGNAQMLKGAIASMLEGQDPKLEPLRPLFQEGLETSEGFVKGFKAFTNDGAGPGQTITDITNAINEFKSLPEGSQLAAAVRYASPSISTSLRLDQLPTAIMANRIKPASTLAEGSRGMIASINREMSTIVNKARPFIKPVLIGMAAAGAAMSLMGPPPGAMQAPPHTPEEPPRTQLTNPNRDDVEIPGITRQVAGQPTSSPLLASRQVQSNSMSHERRKSTRLKLSASGITEEQRQQLAQRLNNRYPNSTINMRVQDDRRSLNPQRVSDMINN